MEQNWNLDINTNDLQKIVSVLFSRLKLNEEKKITLKDDYYWEIPNKDLYDPYHEPEELTIGQLSEDWEELLKLVYAEVDPVPRDLQRLCNILRVISKNMY